MPAPVQLLALCLSAALVRGDAPPATAASEDLALLGVLRGFKKTGSVGRLRSTW